MTLKQKIETDFKQALKSRDAIRTSILRMVKAAITSKEIESKVKELDDNGVVSVLNSLYKKGQESIEQFEKGNRPDLANKEKAEAEILKGYLPEQLNDAELETLISRAILEVNAVGPKDVGKVMKALMPNVTGRADGKKVSELVQKRFASKS
jgi:uncharacterized protein YqeY